MDILELQAQKASEAEPWLELGPWARIPSFEAHPGNRNWLVNLVRKSPNTRYPIFFSACGPAEQSTKLRSAHLSLVTCYNPTCLTCSHWLHNPTCPGRKWADLPSAPGSLGLLPGRAAVAKGLGGAAGGATGLRLCGQGAVRAKMIYRHRTDIDGIFIYEILMEYPAIS